MPNVENGQSPELDMIKLQLRGSEESRTLCELLVLFHF